MQYPLLMNHEADRNVLNTQHRVFAPVAVFPNLMKNYVLNW